MAIVMFNPSRGQVKGTQNLYASAAGITVPTYHIETPPPPGLRRKKIGTALTIGGTALVIGGIAMVSSADALYYNYNTGSNGSYEEGDPKGALGIVMITGGILARNRE